MDEGNNPDADGDFWEKMLNLEGNSAPYLMYTYARLRSILRESGRTSKTIGAEYLVADIELGLILKLVQFPDVIVRVTKDFFPHHLADYLFELAKEANRFYHAAPVLKAEARVRAARLALAGATAGTLKIGLNLLGMKTLERM
jgi:arginyl-tRNA synthetase